MSDTSCDTAKVQQSLCIDTESEKDESAQAVAPSNVAIDETICSSESVQEPETSCGDTSMGTTMRSQEQSQSMTINHTFVPDVLSDVTGHKSTVNRQSKNSSGHSSTYHTLESINESSVLVPSQVSPSISKRSMRTKTNSNSNSQSLVRVQKLKRKTRSSPSASQRSVKTKTTSKSKSQADKSMATQSNSRVSDSELSDDSGDESLLISRHASNVLLDNNESITVAPNRSQPKSHGKNRNDRGAYSDSARSSSSGRDFDRDTDDSSSNGDYRAAPKKVTKKRTHRMPVTWHNNHNIVYNRYNPLRLRTPRECRSYLWGHTIVLCSFFQFWSYITIYLT